MYTLAPLDDNPNRAAAVVHLEDGPRCVVQTLAQESPIYPVAAILAGPRPRPLPHGRYCVHVTAAFPARRLMRSDGIARFTAATWQDVKATLAELSRGGRVITLGVVMTHPGFGPWLMAEEACFLKGYLGQPFQVLAVLDAHRHVDARHARAGEAARALDVAAGLRRSGRSPIGRIDTRVGRLERK